MDVTFFKLWATIDDEIVGFFEEKIWVFEFVHDDNGSKTIDQYSHYRSTDTRRFKLRCGGDHDLSLYSSAIIRFLMIVPTF